MAVLLHSHPMSEAVLTPREADSKPPAKAGAKNRAAPSSENSETEKKTRKPARKNGPGELSRAYRVALYPTPAQAELLSQAIGITRLSWNHLVELQETARKNTGQTLGMVALSHALTELRKDETRPWIGASPRACMEQVVRHHCKAQTAFFDCVAKTNAGVPTRRVGRPTFHKRSGDDAVRFQLDPRRPEVIDLEGHRIHLANVGWVAASFSEPLLGHISAITVRKKAGRWFGSFTAIQVPVDQHKPKFRAQIVQFADPKDPAGIVAVDVGIASRAVCSDGTVLPHPKPTPLQEKRAKGKKRNERKAARQLRQNLKTMGFKPNEPIPRGTKIVVSKRHQQTLDRIAAFDLKTLFKRHDAIHKFTSDLVQRHHTIVVETLALYALAKTLNKGFRRRFHEAAMGEILRQLTYKCELYGRTLIRVDRYFPSSKLCSTMGCTFRHAKLNLSVREWTCPQCGSIHDRDQNAAQNLFHEGVRLLGETPNTAKKRTKSSTTRGSREVMGREEHGGSQPRNGRVHRSRERPSHRFVQLHRPGWTRAERR